ncbi:MAG TPA: cytidylate kinase-like family protein [Myxococcota bacterium]|nr:cytidylate kinase-like family protein [Myxococcota bacterium]
MSSINISRLSYSSGKEIAHTIATQLGYECIADEVFDDAARLSGFDLQKLVRAFCEAPSLFGMSLTARRRMSAHVQAALAHRLAGDNLVYHGPFGHLMIKGVAHILTVRVHAPLARRVAEMVRRTSVDARDAEKSILRDDRRRSETARLLFGADDDDTGNFDLIINTSQVDTETAVSIIAETVKLRRYRPMNYSLRCMQDTETACRAKVALVDLDAGIEVTSDGGRLQVRTRLHGGSQKKRKAEIKNRLKDIEGVDEVAIEAFDGILGRFS